VNYDFLEQVKAMIKQPRPQVRRYLTESYEQFL
jgi:hypothetical protein